MVDVDLGDRLFDFAKNVIFLMRLIPEDMEFKVIKYQVIKSSGSSGANYEEAQSGSSTADFIYRLEISLREMRESNYWLRLIKDISKDISKDANLLLLELIDESNQIKKILGSIVSKMKTKQI